MPTNCEEVTLTTYFVAEQGDAVLVFGVFSLVGKKNDRQAGKKYRVCRIVWLFAVVVNNGTVVYVNFNKALVHYARRTLRILSHGRLNLTCC